ncbi:BatD family protein [Nitratifractor salsuginis]|uniref:Oxygen tolerance n=1 Tax=Nitratifractor salsuginis (strain DSM 16511 / JCM 12458 / E9I37-1) TaxID=749222 RepID=E6X2M9_NITSE|nr:BatD family protein [Nitratifractor salsuginis]ADV46095.1 hypothetical protein Nitsa_0833 [Nitratifractor salsuginis DSM 16511]
MKMIDRVWLLLCLPWLLWGAVGMDLRLSKNTLYLGEPAVVTLRLGITPDTRVDRVRIVAPHSEAFEIRKLDEKKPRIEGGEIRREYRYLLTPLRLGSLSLPPFKAELTWQDPKTYLYTVHSYKTKPLKLTVREVPGGLNPVGDLHLQLTSDRNATQAYEPVHLELVISGEGNLEYLNPFSLRIPGATVYPSAPKLATRPTKEGYQKTFTQRFTVIADHEIHVPPVRLLYFNTNTGIPETLQSPSLTIEVGNPAARRELWLRIALLLGGVLLGAAVMGLWMGYLRDRIGGVRLRPWMSDRELYRQLLPYSDDPKARELLEKLEARLYRGEKEAIDYQEVQRLLRRLRSKRGESV